MPEPGLRRLARDRGDELCRKGETVTYRTYRGVDHLHAGPETAPDVADWVADRFGGKAAPNGRPEPAS